MKPSRRRLGSRAALLLGALLLIAIILFLPSCCCPRGPGARAVPQPAPSPPVGVAHFDVPREAVPAAATQAEFRNVNFRVTETVVLRIHRMRGEMADLETGRPLNFDDKSSFVMRIAYGEIGMTGASLTELMNGFVFAYPGAPLRDLSISVEEGRLIQSGIMHKIIDIPFRMVAEVSATEDGRIRLHPVEIEICNLDGEALMRAFGMDMSEIIDLEGATGVTLEGNDLLIDPLAVIPAMKTEGHLTAVEARRGELFQVFGSLEGITWLQPPLPQEPNWMFFEEGTLRMGKIFMPRADMQVIDTEPSDWFDFFLDHYNNQLSAGMAKIRPDYGLQVYMRDFADLGTPVRPEEELMPVGTLEPRQ
ncbi:MAG: hypothetical protein ACRD2J_03025 [Thermoanaerobaculia bacterium]